MHSITMMSRVLGVSSSGLYAWCVRPASRRAQADTALLAQIRAIYARSRGTLRRPPDSCRAAGAGRPRQPQADRSSHEGGRLGRVSRRKGPRTTIRAQDARPAPDLVERNFAAAGPDQLWVADITYTPTWAGFLYLAVVLDAWSRRVVGWGMATHLRTELVLDALNRPSRSAARRT